MHNGNKKRQPRKMNGWKKRGLSGSNKNGGSNSNFRSSRRGWRRFGGKKFTGNTIDIKHFVNKAEKIEQAEVFEPKHLFSDFAISDLLKKAIAERGFKMPTPIQDSSIPVIIKGKDIIGLANTGTGKTAAFLVPMIDKILANPKEKVLIIVPIRELAIQIQEEFEAFTRKLNLFSVVVVGGASMHKQIKALERRHNVVIATPGRLKDLVDRKKVKLQEFSNVVLDEADRMLDMGFIGEVRAFLSLVAEKRQTMLFSATFSKEVEKLSKEFLKNPEKVSLKTRETSKQIDQDIVKIKQGDDKIEILHDVLNEANFDKALVFARTKYGADKLSRKLSQRGFKSDSIHGDKPHNKRQRVLQGFKKSAIDVLVATDVAARGLDIPDVSHVINFDIPATYEDYVHRIGRTGRADKKGTALTFVD